MIKITGLVKFPRFGTNRFLRSRDKNFKERDSPVPCPNGFSLLDPKL